MVLLGFNRVYNLHVEDARVVLGPVFFFFVTLVTGPRRSLSLKLSDTRVYEPRIPACGTRTNRPQTSRARRTPPSRTCPPPPPACASALSGVGVGRGARGVGVGRGWVEDSTESAQGEG